MQLKGEGRDRWGNHRCNNMVGIGLDMINSLFENKHGSGAGGAGGAVAPPFPTVMCLTSQKPEDGR